MCLTFQALAAKPVSRSCVVGSLICLQDKSCSLAPKVAISLLPDDGDVLLVGTFSGLTVSQTASLIKEKRKANDNKSRVLACVSGLTDAQREAMQQVIVHMGCQSRHDYGHFASSSGLLFNFARSNYS